MQTGAPALTPADHGVTQDFNETDPTPSAQVNGPAWGIQLQNGTLYREPHARIQDPHSSQPTVWPHESQAQAQATDIARMLENWFGIDHATARELRVVRLEMNAAGMWTLAVSEPSCHGYRPIDPYTGMPSAWACASSPTLSVDEARQVMRGHKECAGSIPCKARGRARAVLARAGVMRPNRNPNAWQGLRLPDRAW